MFVFERCDIIVLYGLFEYFMVAYLYILYF